MLNSVTYRAVFLPLVSSLRMLGNPTAQIGLETAERICWRGGGVNILRNKGSKIKIQSSSESHVIWPIALLIQKEHANRVGKKYPKEIVYIFLNVEFEN